MVFFVADKILLAFVVMIIRTREKAEVQGHNITSVSVGL